MLESIFSLKRIASCSDLTPTIITDDDGWGRMCAQALMLSWMRVKMCHRGIAKDSDFIITSTRSLSRKKVSSTKILLKDNVKAWIMNSFERTKNSGCNFFKMFSPLNKFWWRWRKTLMLVLMVVVALARAKKVNSCRWLAFIKQELYILDQKNPRTMPNLNFL